MREITKTVLKFFLGFLVVLVVSTLLAPWFYTFLPFKFERILRRLIMIGTLGLVVWLLRARRGSLGELGLRWKKQSLAEWGRGFSIGILLVAVMTVCQGALGARMWRLSEADGWHWIGFFLKGFSGGVLIGIMEEFFFRGFLFLTFKELWNTKGSLVLTNLIYALVHFFPKSKLAPGVEPTVVESFRLLGAMISPSPGHLLQILPSLAGLALFGLILSFAFLRTGTLYRSMGIHAGAVFCLKLNRRFMPEVSEKMNFLTGTKNLYDGAAGLAVLALAAFLAGRFLKAEVKK